MQTEDVRNLFPIVNRMLYFDAASLTPYCTPVMEALENFTRERRDSASLHFDKWNAEIEGSRKLASPLLKGASPREIAFTKNTSEGVNLTAQLIDWKKGDEVAVCESDFPTNIYPFLNLRSKGVKLRYVGFKGGRLPLEEVKKVVGDKTRLLSISHVFYNSGYRVDLEGIGEMCRETDTLLHVDAAQSLGAFRIDVKKAGVDFLSSCGFKWLLSPLGTGIFYVKKDHLKTDSPVVGWLSVREPKKLDTKQYRLLDSAKRFEAGSPNTGGLLGMTAALKLIHSIGQKAIEKRTLDLSLYLAEKLELSGLKVRSELAEDNRSGIICIENSRFNNDFLKRNSIAATIRRNLRLSPYIYNNEEDIDTLAKRLSRG